ncbi:hypothetical protein [Fusobacterium sp. PH5-44]|uniref:hypothetical protein n=1 Tax=unclassified Fusobacterium TaxID=2648384 RepID=UPI003D1CF2E2
MKEYIINIYDDESDTYDKLRDNVVEVKIYNKELKNIANEVEIEFSMSKSAMLGFGTELIRQACKYKNGDHYHLDPSNDDFQSQNMGIFLTPKSSSIVISCEEKKTIDDYIK